MKLLFTGLQAYLNSGGRYWAQIAIGCLTDPAVLRAIQMAPIEGVCSISSASALP